jgi:hypothetical protein
MSQFISKSYKGSEYVEEYMSISRKSLYFQKRTSMYKGFWLLIKPGVSYCRPNGCRDTYCTIWRRSSRLLPSPSSTRKL